MTTETPTDASTELRALIYTDGGCRPSSRGYAGWGMHGYLYTDTPAKTGTGCKHLITRDGYNAEGSGKPDISVLKYVNGFGALPGVSTNNAAEVTALIRALELCMREGVKFLKVRADSNYTINGYKSWMHGWVKRNWKDQQGQPIINQELWIRAYELHTELAATGFKIEFQHVKGHSGEFGNENADKMATAGVMSGMNGVYEEILELSDAKGYWGTSRENNRMLSHPFRYFSAQGHVDVMTEDGRHIFYTGKMKRDDLEMVGKKISDSSLAIIYLKENDTVLQQICQSMADMVAGTYSGMMIADMGEILKPAQYASLTQFGPRLLVRNTEVRRLIDGPTDTLLCEEARPPFLSFRLVDTLQAMENNFKHYLNGSFGLVTPTDITDILYETSTVGKDDKAKTVVKLKPTIIPGLRTLNVKANYAKAGGGIGVVDLVLTMDQDIPDRNTLSALAAEGVRVTMVTWAESDSAIRFATVIEVNGDAAFWAGAYSNLKLVAP